MGLDDAFEGGLCHFQLPFPYLPVLGSNSTQHGGKRVWLLCQMHKAPGQFVGGEAHYGEMVGRTKRMGLFLLVIPSPSIVYRERVASAFDYFIFVLPYSPSQGMSF